MKLMLNKKGAMATRSAIFVRKQDECKKPCGGTGGDPAAIKTDTDCAT
jgi:hypothetical protein